MELVVNMAGGLDKDSRRRKSDGGGVSSSLASASGVMKRKRPRDLVAARGGTRVSHLAAKTGREGDKAN